MTTSNLTSSGLGGVNQTSGYLHQSAVKANLETNMEMGEEMIKRDEMLSVSEKEWARAAELNYRVDHFPRKVIPYKEYVARKAVEEKALTASKLTLEDEKN